MEDYKKFYINGEWVVSENGTSFPVINPATEKPFAEIALGTVEDIDLAVKAAQQAFPSYSQTPLHDRIELLQKLLEIYKQRIDEMAELISREMGAPLGLAKQAQAPSGLGHLLATIEILKNYRFEEKINSFHIRKEPVGVVGCITPWNWPMNQVVCKVAPALGSGCTVVLKPSEIAPLSAHLFAQMVHDAGFPPGVFNLVNGDGLTAGTALSAHPGVDMVSFTGSTRAGILVAQGAAPSIKRVSQELGGKSPNILLADADIQNSAYAGAKRCFNNSGQSCNAPTRMLVPQERYAEAVAAAVEAAADTKVGDPTQADSAIGPVISELQFNKIQRYIQTGIDEGATLSCGGPGKPEGLETGYYIKPTVFSDVNNEMTIAREEIFGPVLCIIPYKDEEEAIRIANDTPYGLSSYISSGQIENARRVASRIHAGMVHINGASGGFGSPFGGYKQSGNGREWGVYGLEEFLEVKSIMGYG